MGNKFDIHNNNFYNDSQNSKDKQLWVHTICHISLDRIQLLTRVILGLRLINFDIWYFVYVELVFTLIIM